MKSLTVLWQWLAHECANRCHTSTDRDSKTVSARVEGEGVSFLTITLTNFGKDFERSLARGYVDTDLFQGFGFRLGLPVFLQGFLCQIFNTGDGRLLENPSIEAIRSVRQLTLTFGKVNLPCSDARQADAIKGYLETDKEILHHDALLWRLLLSRGGRISETDLGVVSSGSFDHASDEGPVYCERDVSSTDDTLDHNSPASHANCVGRAVHPGTPGWDLLAVWQELFGVSLQQMDNDLYAQRFDRFRPRHGPGATADRLVGNQKFSNVEWPVRLDRIFPWGDFGLPNWGFAASKPAHLLDPGEERPVRVILVPKTLKTPRVIAVEPTAMQFAQQAVYSALASGIEESDTLSDLLGFKRPSDSTNIPVAGTSVASSEPFGQELNQVLARKGSEDQSLATIDLSEASDRVSNLLVRFLMHRYRYVASAIDATRSRNADVPGHGIISLNKYASMGSALCFPIESMVFLAIVLYSIGKKRHNRPLTRREINSLRGQVRVYGDDIIVPADCAVSVMEDLESFGFKVNSSKSFWTGNFRESCGKEYYAGHDVSIVRFRRLFPTSRRDADSIVSLVSFRNQLYWAGYWETCRRLDLEIGRLLDGRFPISTRDAGALTRHSFYPYQEEKHCDNLHRPLIRAWKVVPRIPSNRIDGVEALHKWFIAGSQKDPRHLERSGRPQRVDIKLRWTTPY